MLELLKAQALKLGACHAEFVDPEQIATDPVFRKICEGNGCGVYGKCYTCPPDCGPIEEMMEKLHSYKTALVYQTVGQLEDSFDFEGMIEAGNLLNHLAQNLWDYAQVNGISGALHLGAGGCRLCHVCAKVTGEPCRHPERALGSLESYGVDVTKLAKQAGMPYTNGSDTVTFFGMILV